MDDLKCKCCGKRSVFVGSVDFSKSCEDRRREPLTPSGIPVPYHRCTACGFIFTAYCDRFSAADFAREIYNEDYIEVDPDYSEKRPRAIANMLLARFGHVRERIKVLDYGSGSGATARLLNAQGFDVRNYDPFGTAEDTARPAGKFDLVTCFEVLEHSPNPFLTCNLMRKLARSSGMILFSTLVQPPEIEQEMLGWWYIAPRNGHISIYTRRSLEVLWSRLGWRVASFTADLHAAYRRIPDFARQKDPGDTALAL